MKQCTICRHVERQRIERAIAYGMSMRAVSKEFSASYDSVCRHWHNHVSDEQRARYITAPGAALDKLKKQVIDENIGLIEHYRIIRAQLYIAFDVASEIRDRASLDRLAGRLHENLRDSGRLTGELQSGPLFVQNNAVFVNSPDFCRAIAAIVGAVTPYPDARGSVIAALRALEESVAGQLPSLDRLSLKLIEAAGA